MPISITMPALSPTMTQGTISRWLKKEGDRICAGDVIAEIETDKATMEVEAVDEGILAKILVPEGTSDVAVNSVIALVAEEGEDRDNLSYNEERTGNIDKTSLPASPPLQKQEDKELSTSQKGVNHSTQDRRLLISPLAKRIAIESGLDMGLIQGSGPNGRIIKRDVETHVKNQESAVINQGIEIENHDLEDILRIPHTMMRNIIAQRLSESKRTIPHFYLSADCVLDDLLEARAVINARGTCKLSVNDFVIKACAMALMAVPAAHVTWTQEALIQHTHAHVCVAVATEGGLITPIIPFAHTKGLATISAQMADLAKRARSGKLRPEEFQGGSFTLSNLGMYGVRDFTAIINPPQAMILAVGAGEKRAVVENDTLVIRTVMSITLSIDHRAVDGAVAAQWIAAFKRFIQNPVEMLV